MRNATLLLCKTLLSQCRCTAPVFKSCSMCVQSYRGESGTVAAKPERADSHEQQHSGAGECSRCDTTWCGVPSPKLFGRPGWRGCVCVCPLRSTTTRYHCLNQLCWKYCFKFCSFESIKVNKHTSLSGDLFDPTI